MDAVQPTTPPPQTVFLGRDYEVVLPPLWTPRSVGGVPLHPLNHKWCLWAQKKVKKTAGASWYEGYVCLGRFDTVEGFWQMYSHLNRPEMVQGSADLMLFRDGIRPVWEDEANKGGGKWTLRMKKTGASLVWEELMLNLIGETLDGGSDICGAIISVRFSDNNISLWHRSADSEYLASRLRDSLRSALRLPASVGLEYTRHKHEKKPAAPPSAEGAAGGAFGAFGHRDGEGSGEGGHGHRDGSFSAHGHGHGHAGYSAHGRDGHGGRGAGYPSSSAAAGASGDARGAAGRYHGREGGSGGMAFGTGSGAYGDRGLHGEMTKLSLRGGQGGSAQPQRAAALHSQPPSYSSLGIGGGGGGGVRGGGGSGGSAGLGAGADGAAGAGGAHSEGAQEGGSSSSSSSSSSSGAGGGGSGSGSGSSSSSGAEAASAAPEGTGTARHRSPKLSSSTPSKSVARPKTLDEDGWEVVGGKS